MWTPATRRQHSRDGLRYETDLTDAEWALIEPLMPKPLARGRPREWPLREVMNAIFYVLRGGVAWRLLPTDLPPRTTVYRWFSAWRDTGLFETMNHLLARRWVVERFFAWISRNRRLWKDPEATLTSARAFLYAASVMLLVRRLGRNS